MSIRDQEPTNTDRALIMAAGACIECGTDKYPVTKLVTRGAGESVSLVVLAFLVPNDACELATSLLAGVLDELVPVFDEIERVVPEATH